MDFRDKGDTSPSPLNGIEPNVIELFYAVVMNVEIANLGVEARGGRCDIVERVGTIP